MPYNLVNQLPEYVKKYESKIKRQWMHVFNSTFKTTKSEERAFKAANSVLKKRFKKTTEENSHRDYFNMLMDSFLGNLEG